MNPKDCQVRTQPSHVDHTLICLLLILCTISGSSVPSKPAIPERVGGFPVDFLRQVVSILSPHQLNLKKTVRYIWNPRAYNYFWLAQQIDTKICPFYPVYLCCVSQQFGNEVERQGKASRSTTPRTALSFLHVQMQLSKLLSLKQQVTRTLSQMNTEAEKAVSYCYCTHVCVEVFHKVSYGGTKDTHMYNQYWSYRGLHVLCSM